VNDASEWLQSLGARGRYLTSQELTGAARRSLDGLEMSTRLLSPEKALSRIRGLGYRWSLQQRLRAPDVTIRLHALEMLQEQRVQLEQVPEVVSNVEKGRWDLVSRQVAMLDGRVGLSSDAEATLGRLGRECRRGEALAAVEAALKGPPSRLREAWSRIPMDRLGRGVRQAFRRRVAIADLKQVLAGHLDPSVRIPFLDDDLAVLGSDPDGLSLTGSIRDELLRRGFPIDRPPLAEAGGSAEAATSNLRDMKLSLVAGATGPDPSQTRVVAAPGPATVRDTAKPSVSPRPPIPEVPGQGYRPPLPGSALTDLPPLEPTGSGLKSKALVALEREESRLAARLTEEIGLEREAMGKRASHLGHHLFHLHRDDRDKDDRLDDYAKVKSEVDLKVEIASDLHRSLLARSSRDASIMQVGDLMRLGPRPDRMERLTRGLDRFERAFVRDQLDRGATHADCGVRIFEARLLRPDGTSVQSSPISEFPIAARLRSLVPAVIDPHRLAWARRVKEAVVEH
jgi:hypothetical protein